MGHGHGHDHGVTAAQAHRGRLAAVLGISLTVMVAEGVGGLVSGSFALIADAGHELRTPLTSLRTNVELLVADDVSSALDVSTELALWAALREHGVTVVGSTAKRAALVRADRVVVLIDGTVVDQGTWTDLEPRWNHLAG